MVLLWEDLNAVRKGNWKLVFPHNYASYDAIPGNDGHAGPRYPRTVDSLELYNLMRDPAEAYNVISLYPEKVSELQEVAQQARYELGDLNQDIELGAENREIGKL